MKKVLFMFVAVLALASCQKGADKSSEAAASDSAKTEAVEEKSGEAVEAGENADDPISKVKAAVEAFKAKVADCKKLEDMESVDKDLKALMAELEAQAKTLTPEQTKELTEWLTAPENRPEDVMDAKMKELMPQK